jgi:hypothetical protein
LLMGDRAGPRCFPERNMAKGQALDDGLCCTLVLSSCFVDLFFPIQCFFDDCMGLCRVESALF